MKTWSDLWGMEYELDYDWIKKRMLTWALNEFADRWFIGESVLDVGSGAHPVSFVLRKKKNIVTLDFGGNKVRAKSWTHNHTHVRGDVHDLLAPSVGSSVNELKRKIQTALCKLVKTASPTFDAIFLLEVLSYIDYKRIIPELATLLNVGKSLVIFNSPHRGNDIRHLYHGNWVMQNMQLLDFMKTQPFEQKACHHLEPFGRDILTLVLTKK